MNRGVITKTQVLSTSRYLYDLSKFVAVGGIITPLLNDEQPGSTIALVLLVAACFFGLAFLLDGLADRMG